MPGLRLWGSLGELFSGFGAMVGNPGGGMKEEEVDSTGTRVVFVGGRSVGCGINEFPRFDCAGSSVGRMGGPAVFVSSGIESEPEWILAISSTHKTTNKYL